MGSRRAELGCGCYPNILKGEVKGEVGNKEFNRMHLILRDRVGVASMKTDRQTGRQVGRQAAT